MSKIKKNPWKSGYGAILFLFALAGMYEATVFSAFSLHDPSDKTAIIFFGFGLFLFGTCAVFGVANWIVEKKVNEKLVFLEYVKPFDADFNMSDDPEDPLISLLYNESRVNRHDDAVYTVDLVQIALGVNLYIFRDPKDVSSNFCIVYSRYGLYSYKLKPYERVK